MNKLKSYRTYLLQFLAAILFFNTIFYLNIALSETQYPNISAEKYVIGKVDAGEIADLNKMFTNEEDRILDASFLVDLFTDSIEDVKVHRNGIQIKNAVITGEFNLKNSEIQHEIKLLNCSFYSKVIFSRSHFHKGLNLEGSKFDGASRFVGMRVDGDFILNNAMFDASVDFHDTDITGHFFANDAKFNDPNQSVFFNFMKVGGKVFLNGAAFCGNVSFTDADITGYFNANGATFSVSAHFDSMKVGGYSSFGNTSFYGDVSFRNADITGYFNANGATFSSHTKRSSNITIELGMSKEEIESYNEAISINPEDAAAHIKLGDAYVKMGMNDRAIELYNKAISINPEDADAYNNLGDSYVKMGMNDRAIESYNKAISINPEDADAHYNLGVAFSGAGEYEEGIKSYKEAIKINPENAKAYYTLGDLFNKLGWFEKAIDEYKQARLIGHDHTTKDHGVAFFADRIVSFESMKVGDKAFFDNTSFDSEVSFSNADITGHFSASGATFSGPARFSSMKVGGNAFFRNTSFDEYVSFSDATITGDFDSSNAKFSTHPKWSNDITVNFIDMEVGGDAFFVNTISDGNMSFRNTTIGDVIDFSSAKFFSLPDYAVDFRGMRVGNKVSFDNAIFVVFKDSSLITVDNISDWNALLYEIKGNKKNLTTKLLTSKLKDANQLEEILKIDVKQVTEKLNEDIIAAFNTIKDNLTFYKDNKEDIDVAFDAIYKANKDKDAGKGIKRSPEVQKELNNLKEILEESGELKKEESDLTDLQKVDIKWFNIAILKELFPQILSKSRKKVLIAAFDKMEVGDLASFKNVNFRGDVSIVGAKINKLDITGPKMKNNKSSNKPFTLVMDRSEIKSMLHIENLKLKEFLATSLHVSGITELYNLDIKDKVILEHSIFLRIMLNNVCWPKRENGSEPKILISGMTYQDVTSRYNGKVGTFSTLLAIVDSSKYDVSNYKYLENYFNRQGYPGRGDVVYMAQKRREINASDNLLEKFNGVVSRFCFGYGRKRVRGLAIALYVVIFGTFLYRSEQSMVRTSEKLSHRYNCFWYSLDLFLPLIDLKVANNWIPKDHRNFAKSYMHFHKFLGMLLTPVSIVGFSGVIN